MTVAICSFGNIGSAGALRAKLGLDQLPEGVSLFNTVVKPEVQADVIIYPGADPYYRLHAETMRAAGKNVVGIWEFPGASHTEHKLAAWILGHMPSSVAAASA